MSPLLQESLRAIAELAVRETGAAGYTVFEDRGGAPVPFSDVDGQTALPVLAYRLGSTGVAAFSFHDSAALESVRSRVDRAAEILNSIWEASAPLENYTTIAERLAELETRLLDAKIADRARGLLQEAAPRRDAIEEIARHVSGVLRPSSAREIIAGLVKDLEKEIDERNLATRAK